jgi:hypothetical protein
MAELVESVRSRAAPAPEPAPSLSMSGVGIWALAGFALVAAGGIALRRLLP